MQIAMRYALQEPERFDIICAKGGGSMRVIHEVELANCILQDKNQRGVRNGREEDK